MAMNNFEACAVVAKHRDEKALIVSTMSAMFGISATSPSPLNLSSVPLMGGASGLGLGLAIAQPERAVMVLDGDASLLMELGTLAQIGEQAPGNFIHLVFNNHTQFASLGNVDRPGDDRFDFSAVALGAGYASAHRVDNMARLNELLPVLLQGDGPHLIDLQIDVPERLVEEIPQPELPDLQFGRMRAESRAMMDALGTTR